MNQKMQEAMKTAIEHENKSRDNYKRLADEAEDQETRLLFEQLSHEEAMHSKKISERLKALKMMG
ncbi:MAG: ferritin family protein [Syntrophomonadaceae bacterium]|nr:ferritin family protein [Syntrophomonadaceae bacterium]MDD3022860.1 ferritin family protein [Syntrophomonadaceae bacterium]